MAAHPDFPWLDPADLDGLRGYLADRAWLQAREELRRCERAGDGNMNLTLRVHTNQRSFVLKQSRPWVEKYDEIAAPWDRTRVEQRFYERIAEVPSLRARMPELLASDPAARVIVLEDLPDASDLSTLYAAASGAGIEAAELDELARYLRSLHDAYADAPDATLANREMRALNHAHIFEVPLDPENGLDLDAFEAGLAAAAGGMIDDDEYRRLLKETGARYLEDGRHLVHGDFFPGSWLRSSRGLRVIDPEFCFFGDREVDLGCALAHLALARQGPALARRLLTTYAAERDPAYDPGWLARYAAAEVMRRLIGVAQLPIPPTRGFRANLLARSRRVMCDGKIDAFWE
ncbi:MAG: phosphotransferase [Myxococcota bacterium]